MAVGIGEITSLDRLPVIGFERFCDDGRRDGFADICRNSGNETLHKIGLCKDSERLPTRLSSAINLQLLFFEFVPAFPAAVTVFYKRENAQKQSRQETQYRFF